MWPPFWTRCRVVVSLALLMAATTAPRKKRATAVAPPGAKRLTLTGIMAVPDDFGRIRILLVESIGSRPDFSWKTLHDELPDTPGSDFKVPYRLQAIDSEGVRGEFWAVAPAHRREHWLAVAAATRGRSVRVEVTVRSYMFPAATDGTKGSHGASLDVSMIDPV